MASDRTDTSLGFGVYFAPQDYVGFGPRMVILVIDSLVILAFLWLLRAATGGLVGDSLGPLLALGAPAIWLYLVPLKSSVLRTIGYQFAGCWLTTLQGTRPSLFMMTFRCMFWCVGPLNLVLDFIWCGIDQDRQTLRDRYAGVMVVKQDAEPIGEGPIHLAYYDAMGTNLMLAHVVHAESEEEGKTDAE